MDPLSTFSRDFHNALDNVWRIDSDHCEAAFARFRDIVSKSLKTLNVFGGSSKIIFYIPGRGYVNEDGVRRLALENLETLFSKFVQYTKESARNQRVDPDKLEIDKDTLFSLVFCDTEDHHDARDEAVSRWVRGMVV